MRFDRYIKYILVFLTLVLTLYLLPNFSFTIGDKIFSWGGIDFDLVGIQSPLANFTKGQGIYTGTDVKMNSNYSSSQQDALPELFASDLNLIQNRLEVSGLKDLSILTQQDESNHSVLFRYPNYYTPERAQLISSLLTATGSIDLWEDAGADSTEETGLFSYLLAQIAPDYKPKTAAVTLADIESVSTETRSNLQTASGDYIQSMVLKLKFRENAQERLNATVSTTDDKGPMLLVIDSEPIFVVQPVTGSLEAVAIPIFSNDITEVKIMASYLTLSGVMRGSFQYSSTAEVPAIYAEQGRTVLALCILVGFAIFGVWAFRKWGRQRFWNWGLAFASYVVLGLAVLKLAAAPISIGFLVGILFAVMIGLKVTTDLMEQDSGEFKDRLTVYRNLAVFMFILGWLIFMSGLTFGVLYEFVVTVTIMAAALLFSTAVSFKYIINNRLVK